MNSDTCDNRSTSSLNQDLYDYCHWNYTNKTQSLLESYPNIDVLDNDGICFSLAISKSNYEIFDALLSYYEDTKLTGDPRSFEYQKARNDLRAVLDDVLEGVDIEDEEIAKRIKPYITDEHSSERDEDFSDIESIHSNSSFGGNLPPLESAAISDGENQFTSLNWRNLNALNQSKEGKENNVKNWIENWQEEYLQTIPNEINHNQNEIDDEARNLLTKPAKKLKMNDNLTGRGSMEHKETNFVEKSEHSSMKENPKDQTEWYSDEKLQQLLQDYVSSDIIQIVTSVSDQDQLVKQLQKLSESDKSQHVIPLNVNVLTGELGVNQNHWVAIYINQSGDKVDISYIDPMGRDINKEVSALISNTLKTNNIIHQPLQNKPIQYVKQISDIELNGNLNDCGPMLIYVLGCLVRALEVTIEINDVAESKSLGLFLRKQFDSNIDFTDIYRAIVKNTNYNSSDAMSVTDKPITNAELEKESGDNNIKNWIEDWQEDYLQTIPNKINHNQNEIDDEARNLLTKPAKKLIIQKPEENMKRHHSNDSNNDPLEDKDLVIITGTNGQGKTRFLNEYKAKLEKQYKSDKIISDKIIYVGSDAVFKDVQGNIGLSTNNTFAEDMKQDVEIIFNLYKKNNTPSLNSFGKPAKNAKHERILKQLESNPTIDNYSEAKTKKEIEELLNRYISIYGRQDDPIEFLNAMFQMYHNRATEISQDIDMKRDYLELHDYYHAKNEKLPNDNSSFKQFMIKVRDEKQFIDELLAEYGRDKSGMQDTLARLNKNLETINFKYTFDLHFSANSNYPTVVAIKANGAKHATESLRLSSGEKWILGVLMWQFKLEDPQVSISNTNTIKIMLLDEPDRHLDPKLCKQFLKIVKDVFTGQAKMKVMMTTHRVDTVSLAPDDSIYKIEKDKDQYNLSKIHKLEAMFRMTSNFREMMNYHHKVYTESFDDAKFYKAIYNALRAYSSEIREEHAAEDSSEKKYQWDIGGKKFRILSERCQLDFYSVSTDGPLGGGDVRVIHNVQNDLNDIEHYREKANKSEKQWLFNEPKLHYSYGIIDNDGKSTEALINRYNNIKAQYTESSGEKVNLKDLVENNIVVPQKRCSLENFIYDPFILSALSEEELNNICNYIILLEERLKKEAEDKVKEAEVKNNQSSQQALQKAKGDLNKITGDKNKKWIDERKKTYTKLTEAVVKLKSNIQENNTDQIQQTINQYFETLFNHIKSTIDDRPKWPQSKTLKQQMPDSLQGTTKVPITIISGLKTTIQVQYPEFFCKIPGHPMEDMLFGEEIASDVSDKIIKLIYNNSLQYIPLDLAEIFFELSNKAREHVRKIIKADTVEVEEISAQLEKKVKIDDENSMGSSTKEHAETSFWYEYSKVAMKQLLELRLISTNMESEANVIHPSYVFSEATKLAFTQDLATQIASIADISPGSKILIPINIDNQHWVGMTIEFTADDKILINYMDSERNPIPMSLETGLLQELSYAFPNLAVEINTQEVEQQKYNNCGLEVIENLIAAVAGEAARMSQEDALAVHSALYEDNLINEFVFKEAKSEKKTMKIAWKEVQNQQIIERVEEILLEETNSDYIFTASKFQHQHPAPVLGGIETVKNLLETLLRFISGEVLPGGKSITDGITTMQSVPDISVPTPIIAETNPIFEDFMGNV